MRPDYERLFVVLSQPPAENLGAIANRLIRLVVEAVEMAVRGGSGERITTGAYCWGVSAEAAAK